MKYASRRTKRVTRPIELLGNTLGGSATRIATSITHDIDWGLIRQSPEMVGKEIAVSDPSKFHCGGRIIWRASDWDFLNPRIPMNIYSISYGVQENDTLRVSLQSPVDIDWHVFRDLGLCNITYIFMSKWLTR